MSYGGGPSWDCGCRLPRLRRSTTGSRRIARKANFPWSKRDGGRERYAGKCHPRHRWHSGHSRHIADARARHAKRAARPDARLELIRPLTKEGRERSRPFLYAVIPGRAKRRTRNPEIIDQDSGFALT